MFMRSLLEDHFNQAAKFNLSKTLRLPFTHIGIHPVEMNLAAVKKKAPKFIRSIEEHVKYLKDRKIPKEHSGVSYPDNLYKLIQSWSLNSALGFPREIGPIEAKYFQEINEQYFYSVIYDNILNGKTDSRGIRLHFSNVSVPITLKCHETIRSIPLTLKSISRGGLLFKVHSSCKYMMEQVKSFEITLDHRSLFESKGDLGDLFISDLLMNYDHKEKNMDKIKLKRFSVPMSKVSFSTCLIEKAKALGQNNHSYLCIPFSALEDPVLMTTAGYGKALREGIDTFEDRVLRSFFLV